MVNPPINEMLDKADCRYTLVVEVAKRARELVDGAPPLVEVQTPFRPVSVAVEEVHEGYVTYSAPENTVEAIDE